MLTYLCEFERKMLQKTQESAYLCTLVSFKNFFPCRSIFFFDPYRCTYWISPIIPKIHNYLQILEISQCHMNNSNLDSELIKPFFRKFRKFLTPGLQVPTSLISWGKKEFWKFEGNYFRSGPWAVFLSYFLFLHGMWLYACPLFFEKRIHWEGQKILFIFPLAVPLINIWPPKWA